MGPLAQRTPVEPRMGPLAQRTPAGRVRPPPPVRAVKAVRAVTVAVPVLTAARPVRLVRPDSRRPGVEVPLAHRAVADALALPGMRVLLELRGVPARAGVALDGTRLCEPPWRGSRALRQLVPAALHPLRCLVELRCWPVAC